MRFIIYALLSYSCQLYFAKDTCSVDDREANKIIKNVKLYLYTRQNTTKPELEFYINETDILRNSTFNNYDNLVLIIHGYNSAPNESYIHLIKEAYLRKGKWNVIAIDWSSLSGEHYNIAVANARSVAVLLARWLSRIMIEGHATTCNTNLVGHSIGAHIAGILGKCTMGKKIAKIYALDPPKIIYERKPETERLHKSDANFVLVIHTCSGIISFVTNIGHVDFYPNGGLCQQPNCFNLDVIELISCSHASAVRYFTESIKDERKFMATKCETSNQFSINKCNGERVPMGYATPIKTRGNFYLMVNLETVSENFL